MLFKFLEYLNGCIKNFEDKMDLSLLIKRFENEKGSDIKRYIYYIILRSGASLYDFTFSMDNSTDFLNDIIHKIISFNNHSIKYEFLDFEPKLIIESKYKKIKIEIALNWHRYYPDQIRIINLLGKGNNDIDPISFDESKTFNLTSDEDYQEIEEFIYVFKYYQKKYSDNLDIVVKIKDYTLFIYIRCNEKLFSYEFKSKDSKFFESVKNLCNKMSMSVVDYQHN